jgi:predicted acyltransferase
VPEGPSSPSSRLLALDVFRGVTMAAMVIVNNPGSWDHVHAPLLHAEWNGWTPPDLIFPFFLFIVGVSLTLSRRSLGAGGPILRRAMVIFGLGLLLAGYPRFDVTRWRIPGVLQRIAVCYLAAAIVYRISARKGAHEFRTQATRIGVVSAVLLIGYWGAMTLVPVPGGGAGDLSADGNLAAFVDRLLMGGHLWRPSWDPEGLLSTVPAIATTLLGVLAGLWIRQSETRGDRGTVALAGAGLLSVLAGQVFGAFFPINKNLWTSSYVLFTGGMAAALLAALIWAIDVAGSRRWTMPFVVLGRNAITLFVLSGLLVKTLILIKVPGGDGRRIALSAWTYDAFYAPVASPKNASLLYALTHLVILFGVLSWMHRRRIFLKA